MRSKAMKKCAVGAMLFCGTLVVVQQASAGFSWAIQDDRNRRVADVGFVWPNDGDFMSGQLCGEGATYGGYQAWYPNAFRSPYNPGYTMFDDWDSNPTLGANGWGISAYVPALNASFEGNSWARETGSRRFSVTGSESVRISIYARLQGADWAIRKNGVVVQSFAIGNNGFGAPPAPADSSNVSYVTLTAGDYVIDYSAIRLSSTDGSAFLGTMMTFEVGAVPAPGAAALIGLAGLMTRRRKA